MSDDRVSYRLDGQMGVITRSANGIGRALAIVLAQGGADTVVADGAKATAAEVRARGRHALEYDSRRHEEPLPFAELEVLGADAASGATSPSARGTRSPAICRCATT